MEVIKNGNLLMRIFESQGLILSVFSIGHAAYSCEQLTFLSLCPLRSAGNTTLRLTKPKHDKTEKSSLNGPAYHPPAAEPRAVILHCSETSQAQQPAFTFLTVMPGESQGRVFLEVCPACLLPSWCACPGG